MGVPADDWVAKASAPDAKSWERTLLKHYQLITLVKGDEAASNVLALQTSRTASYEDLDNINKVWRHGRACTQLVQVHASPMMLHSGRAVLQLKFKV